MKRLLLIVLLFFASATAEARTPVVYRLFGIEREVVVVANRLIVITEPEWCLPCREIDPHLKQLKNEGFDVYTFSLSDWKLAKPKPTNLPKVVEDNARLRVPTVMYVEARGDVNKVVKYHMGGKKYTADYMKRFLRK